MTLSPSAHVDTFTRDSLPPEADWPTLEFTLPELRYPDRLNAAAELIDRSTAQFGAERPALLLPDGSAWSYGELQARANQFARLLTDRLGVVPGNRVLLRLPNSPLAVACWLGTLKAGAVIVTTMTAWKHRELDNVLTRVMPTVAVIDAGTLAEVADTFAAHLPADGIWVSGGDDDPLGAALDAQPTEFTAVATAADDVALLGATSGTTGAPKITMHFHRDILANADTFARHILHLGPDDVSASTAPLAFTFGLGGLVVFPLRTGGAAVIAEHGGPVQLAELIDTLGITVFYTAPTGYRALLAAGHAAALGRLRLAVSAGQHLPRSTFDEVEAASGVRLIDGIGSTEMLHVFVSASGADIRPGRTGRAIPGFRAAVFDDEGRQLGPGEPGLLGVIGPTGCRYLNDDRQRKYVSNGWNITGDTYVMDEEGYFAYLGRADSLIVTAGYNVGAPEVENALAAHPAVAECAVVGRPDPHKGTIVNAFVVLMPGQTPGPELTRALLDHARAELALYKCPRRIDYIDALPTNASGKVQHFVLRERAAAEAEAEAAAAHSTPTGAGVRESRG